MQRIGCILLVLGAWALTWAEPSPDAREPATAAPDLLFFARSVAVDLNARCASCHSDPEMGAGYLLVPLDDLERPNPRTLLRNFRATVAFVDPEHPEASPLLHKALGEDGHAGGALYRTRATRDFERLQHFAMGASLRNRPPEAIVQERYDGKVGVRLELDGTLSGDPDGHPLGYRWRLRERPPGSRAQVEDDGKGSAFLRPDRAGVYQVELRVTDRELWSLPASLLVVASADRPAPEPETRPDPEGAKSARSTPAAMVRPLVDRRLDPDRLRMIRRLYLDLKRRTPRMQEITRWYDRSHEAMVNAFLDDVETWDSWYEHQLFYFLLLDQFRPKEGRITTIPERLRKGEITPIRALEEIVRSQYFGARNPGNDTFVTVVLEQCLGLVVQERPNLRMLETGKKMYDGYRVKLFKQAGRSQADFVRICFRQRAVARHFLSRTFKDLHGFDAPPKRLAPSVDRLRSDPGAFRDILREWLTAPDYAKPKQARTKAEIPYVRSLFMDALGRLPSYEELRNVRNAFLSLADPTPVRLVMGRVLLQSPEVRMPASSISAERFVKEQFVRLFARPATRRELDTFVNALKNDPQVTPGVVLWTLISSPEYQSY